MGLVTAKLNTLYGFCRIIRDTEDRVTKIIEEKDASPVEKILRNFYWYYVNTHYIPTK